MTRRPRKRRHEHNAEPEKIRQLKQEVAYLSHEVRDLSRRYRFIISQHQESTMALEGAGSTFNPQTPAVTDNLISGTAATPTSSQLVTGAPNAQAGAEANLAGSAGSTAALGPAIQPGLAGLAPGSTGTLSLALYDQNGVVVVYETVAELAEDGKTVVKPTWTSSDTTNAPLTVAEDGMSATVTVPGNDAAGTPATITVTATLKNGTTATGTALLPITAPITYSFILTQS